MKLFQNLFGKGSGIEIAAPAAGRLVAIREVNDPTFADEILGKGVAVIPADGRICAPADGTVSTVFPTGHAAALTTDSGVEILIHIGLDTVKLNGKHFTVHAKEGDKVKKGDLLLEADIGKIREEGYDTITPMVVCNSDEFSKFEIAPSGDVSQGDVVLTLEK